MGYVRREKRRKVARRPRYRSGIESLSTRVEKKLVAKYNWFRKKRDKEEEERKDENENKRERKKEEWR